MHGLKAFNLYMIVERERWQGSPITRHGDVRPEYEEFYKRLNAFLHHYRFWEFKRDSKVLVLRNYDLGRFAAAMQTLSYAHMDLLGLPSELFHGDADLKLRWDAPAEADESRCDTWLGNLTVALAEQSLDYDIADTHTDMARLAKYSVTFLNAADFMDLDDQQRILEAISAGATVVMGPGLPYTDPTMQRPGILDRYLEAPGVEVIGRGRLIWAKQSELPMLLSRLAPSPEFSCDDPNVSLSVWRKGEETLLFTANATSKPLVAHIFFEGEKTLRDVWCSDEILKGRQPLDIQLRPYAVRIWEVEHD
jgi:beta-galactosidase